MKKWLKQSLTSVALLAFFSGCMTNQDVREPGQPPGMPPAPEMLEPPQQINIRKTVDEQLAELDELVKDAETVPKLGKGDLLSISVYDEPDLSLKAVPIRPDGKISFPLAGDLVAADKSVQELTDDITERLKRYLLSPRVSVVVNQFNSLKYTLYGEVVNPGVYPLVTDMTITEALAKAGGLRKGQFRASHVELADLTHAFISRDGNVLPVDFVKLLREGDLRFDIPLQTGDYIYIPSGLSKEVYIIGEVNKASIFAFREEMPMSRTVSLAEGFTPDADLSRIHVIRGALQNPTLIVADFTKVIAGEAQDVQLEPGDIVYVPPTGLIKWARIINSIMPTIQALQLGIILSDR